MSELSFREIKSSDAEIFFKIFKEDKKNLSEFSNRSIEDLKKDFGNENENGVFFVINYGKEIIGLIGFEEGVGEAFVGYYIRKKFRNKGFGKGSLKFIENYLFDIKKVKKIILEIKDLNSNSIKLALSSDYKKQDEKLKLFSNSSNYIKYKNN